MEAKQKLWYAETLYNCFYVPANNIIFNYYIVGWDSECLYVMGMNEKCLFIFNKKISFVYKKWSLMQQFFYITADVLMIFF